MAQFDHPNVIRLEGVVTRSKTSFTLGAYRSNRTGATTCLYHVNTTNTSVHCETLHSVGQKIISLLSLCEVQGCHLCLLQLFRNCEISTRRSQNLTSAHSCFYE